MLLKDLVEISKRVGATAKKKEKVSLLAHFFQQAKGKEIAIAVDYLSGQLSQGRLGIGWATLQEALKDLSDQFQPLSLFEMDRLFEAIFREKGAGSSERKDMVNRI